MNQKFLNILVGLLCFLSYGQYSNDFKSIVKDIEEVESKTDTLYYANGKIWIEESYSIYTYQSKKYSFLTGNQIQYHKNGQIESILLYGKYGNILSSNSFDRDGNKTCETITTYIDTKAKNLNDYLSKEYDNIVIRNFKYFKCSYKLGVCYLFKEGNMINGVKNGKWRFYNEKGVLKKEKNY